MFGKAADFPDKLAKTVCTIMIKCLFGGPEFIAKILPVSNLSSNFFKSQLTPILQAINSVVGGRVLAVITDGHKINQKLFRCLNNVPDKTWCGQEGMFLLYDYVHLMKNIRNNWLTEKSGELEFEFKDEKYTCKWADLKLL